MLTADLPLEEKLKDLIAKFETDTISKIAKGSDVRGTRYHAIRAGEIVSQVEEDDLPDALVKLGADHLLILLVENNKGEDFNAGEPSTFTSIAPSAHLRAIQISI